MRGHSPILVVSIYLPNKKYMKEYLTEKQEAVLNFIEEYQMTNGKSPTIREMREHFGVSSDNSILKHVKALNEKGFVEKDDTPRGIKILESVKKRLEGAKNAFKLPILGFIPAGGPVLTEEHVEGWMTIGDDLARNATDFFLLNVKGESMIDAGIFEGDLVLVNSRKQAKNGDVVVALVDGSNTLKRLVKEGGKSYLRAENKNYSDIHPAEELSTQGVVVSMIRQFA